MAVLAARGQAPAVTRMRRLPWGQIGRHALHLVVLGLMAWMVVWGYRTLNDPWTFPIRVVKVDGELHRLAPMAVQSTVDNRLQGSFFGVELKHVLEGLSGLAWVREARVRREWPDTLHLWIDEHKPLALWRGDAVLTADGMLIYPGIEGDLLSLPALSGGDGREMPLWGQFNSLRQAMSSVGLTPRAMREDQRGSLTVVLDNGMAIRVGREDTEARMRRFLEVFDKALKPRMDEVQEVDLRYAHGFSVRWKTTSSG
ncbi:MAG: FtsQ-type POTRA domain-containing protein [Halothiobacillaceae bacterium]|nr:MAG: FtsQ-type POTRA domain-containing protein [Halothiobacillaceae bacterium]